MKTFLKIIAWMGLAIMGFSTVLQLSDSWNSVFPPPDYTMRSGLDFSPFFFFIAAFGLVLMLIGGVLARPRFFWIAAIIIGFLNIASFFGVWPVLHSRIHHKQIGAFFFELSYGLPGLLAILEGIILRFLERKRKVHNHEKEICTN